MSRRKASPTPAMETELIINCSKGHRVGVAYKMGPNRPDAGRYVVANGVKYRDESNQIHAASGRVRGVCSRRIMVEGVERPCGEDVQITWRRILNALDALETQGKQRGGCIAP